MMRYNENPGSSAEHLRSEDGAAMSTAEAHRRWGARRCREIYGDDEIVAENPHEFRVVNRPSPFQELQEAWHTNMPRFNHH